MGIRRAGPLFVGLALVLGCGSGDHPSPPTQPDLVLISVDALRADHLGAYGHFLDVSPNVDRLAAEGVLFDEATAQWPSTWPSMASMLTGMYPGKNGVAWKPKRALDWSHVTLADALQAAGYRTGAVVSNASLGKRMQFEQGFDWFAESWQEAYQREHPGEGYRNRPGKVKRYTNATIVTDLALGWLGRQDAEAPVFLWVHYMDPHGPYEPPDAYASHYTDAYPTKTVRLRDIPEYQRLTPPGAAGPTDDLNYYLASYDREIRYLDDELGRLFAALDERWGAQSGLIAFTADHGESMDEHGEYLGHGRLPFRPSTRVPLILRMPGRVPSGRRLATPVGMTSLLPTLLELVGVAVPETAQGHSLVPWIDGDAPEPDPAVFGYAGIDLPPQSFMRRGPFKLVRFTQDREIERFGGRLALYDIANDPGETRNVIRDHPAVAERMRQELEDWFEENWRRTGVASGRPIEFDEQEAEMLRQLGYGR